MAQSTVKSSTKKRITANVASAGNNIVSQKQAAIIPNLRSFAPGVAMLTPIANAPVSAPSFAEIPTSNKVTSTTSKLPVTTVSALDSARNTIGGTVAEMQKQNQNLINQQNLFNQQMQQQYDIEARINALNQAKQAQAVADLGKAKETQLSNLAQEETGIKPMYYDKRNATAATNMIGRRTLAEELAARGETKSGVADEANIRANMSLQGETGALNRQEAADISDIARRRTGVQNAYESDVVSARAGLEAAAMQNLIDQYNADRQFKLSEAGVTGLYGGNQTLDALNANRNFALNEAGVTGNYNGSQTLDALNADRQFKLNEAGLTGSYNGNQTLDAQSQTFNQDLATKQFNQQQEQQKLDNLYRQQTFDYQKSRDAVSDSQWQQSMNLNLRQQSFQESQQKIENALSQKRISQDDAAQALQWAKFNAEQDPNSLDNQLKKANIDLNTYSKNTSALNDTIQRLDSLYIYKDSSGVPNRNPNYSDAQLRSAIIGLNLSDDQTDTLLLRYGLKIN